ncbi:MAG: response regulator [Anaerolineaceae bacterium]|nr:response regulator [Anaerolineaceae bacterium]
MAKILVVDDEQLTVDMLTTFLELIGHEAISAMSGRQTWDRLAYEEPDAVLLDIMLPDSNGIDICRQLRNDPNIGNITIIMISAMSPPLMREATAAGANDYLVKPINLKALKKSLAEAGVMA